MLQYIDTRYQFLPRWLEEIGNDAPKLCQNFDITYKLNSLTLLAICLVWHSPTWLDDQLRNSFKVNQPTVRPHLLLLLSVRSSRTRRRIKSIGLNLSLENFFFFFTHISIHRFILHSFFQKCTVAKRITNNNNNKTAFIQCLIVVLFCVDWRDVSPQLKQLLLAVRPSQQKNNSTTCPSCASMIFPHLPLSLPTLYLYLTRCHTHTKSLSLALPSAQLFSIHFLSLSPYCRRDILSICTLSYTHTSISLSLPLAISTVLSLSLTSAYREAFSKPYEYLNVKIARSVTNSFSDRKRSRDWPFADRCTLGQNFKCFWAKISSFLLNTVWLLFQYFVDCNSYLLKVRNDVMVQHVCNVCSNLCATIAWVIPLMWLSNNRMYLYTRVFQTMTSR